MRLRPSSFSRDCTEDSVIPVSCEMKDKTALKPLQGNSTLFRVRESPYPLRVREQFQGPSHILIAEGRLMMIFCWNVGYLFNRILGINSLLDTIWGAWKFPRDPVLKLVFLQTEDVCLREFR